MSRVVGRGQPQLTIAIWAPTARKTLLRVITASEFGAYDGLIALDPTAPITSGVQGPQTAGPKANTIPDEPPAGATAGYSQTNPQIRVEGVIRDSAGYPIPNSEVVQRVTDSLRMAESWGWSRVLSLVDTIIVNGLIWEAFLAHYGQQAIAPPPYWRSWMFLFPLGTGRNVVVRNEVISQWSVRARAWLLVHEALHHSLYSEVPFPNSPFPISRWTYPEFQHHLGTSLASIGNSAILDTGDAQGADVDNLVWPSPSHALYPLKPARRSASSQPDLRTKSVIQPVPTEFGQRLDAIEPIISDWGLGGWIDKLGPNLNYSTWRGLGCRPVGDGLEPG